MLNSAKCEIQLFVNVIFSKLPKVIGFLGFILALVSDVYCNFSIFPCGILGQVWYMIVSFPNLCQVSYFNYYTNNDLFL